MQELYVLLFLTGFLYLCSWFYTTWRTESVLITVNKKLARVLFFIKSSKCISVVSIILGLFAHFSLIFFLVLVFLNNVTGPYMELVVGMWVCLGFSLMCAGEAIETCIKIRSAEKKELLVLAVILICLTGVMIYMIGRYAFAIVRLYLYFRGIKA